MPKVQLPIKNFEAQDLVFHHPARYKIVVKGRRLGLTKGAANNFIERALKRTFKKGLWVDTINSNIDRYVERYFIPALQNLPQGTWRWAKQAKVLYILDSYIDFRSADNPESIEGFGYDLAFLNEAGIILKNEYLWNNAIRPMLWDYQAEAIIGGTPKGGGGEFERLAQRGKDPDQPLYAYFHFTTFDNPYLNKEEIAEEIKDMPEQVRKQEIYAEFLADSGVVFRNVHKIMVAEPKDSISGHFYVMGVDLAKHQDFTVITVYDRQNNAQVYQERFNQLDWPLQKRKIANVSKRYNNAVCYLDATGIGDPIADDLLRIGVPVEPITLTNTSKKEIIEKAVVYTEQYRVTMIDLDDTLKEFRNFTYDMTSNNKVRYNAPEGFHDDIVMSHCLAIWGLNPIYAKPKEDNPTPIQEHFRRITGRESDVEYDVIDSDDYNIPESF